MTRKEITFLKKYNTHALDLLHNKYVLFFILFIAVLNLCGFVYTADVKSVCVFVLSGIMTSFFSENMVVILVVAMVIANIIRQYPNLEGFKKKKMKMKMKKNKKKAKKKINQAKEIVCDEYDEECLEAKERADEIAQEQKEKEEVEDQDSSEDDNDGLGKGNKFRYDE